MPWCCDPLLLLFFFKLLCYSLTFYAFPTKTSEFLHPKFSPYFGNKTAKRWRFRGVRLSLQGGLEASYHVKSSNKFKANCCDERGNGAFPTCTYS
ncbi:hypothetical protein OIU74_002157 [Salix koriyanagi]|uniref:Uncharacterized protein n=1 Tax=Salix koriyanagi TaxID=2511006 RepID=A0A9Q0X3Z2_9ROSI|nr:hypothetical protein OIU74_002157 [Salix koriyanagi]